MATQTAEQFADAMERRAGHVNEDFAPLLRQFVKPIRLDIQDHFDKGQDAEGNAWPEHSPATVARYGPHQLLVLSGELEAAATGHGPHHFEEITGDTLTYGVIGIPYARRQNYGDQDAFNGDDFVQGHIPQREYMALSENCLAELNGLTSEFMVDRILGEG